ncbi:WhiB family transcriptional regulator [Actinokineospora globicatena]|uniref:Transcriptional regulator WhiB n=1 Tax=Actinokineospora globicatena TaxID=103729 RepID=A0A9W6QNC3_9PSEU|nr:WhiB family transcriptional regulator [Actinokineospora globicatena]GLW91795.1 hypothetical protein Aglo03_26110 [Actinokineospora globicatena]
MSTCAPSGYATAPKAVPAWHQDAACRLFPELDFVEAKPGSPQEHAARIICAACPVRLQCATGALERGEPFGVWAGLNRRDRTDLARAHGYPRPGIPPEHGTDARYKKWDCRCPDCRRGHAVYEFDRRHGAIKALKRRKLWASPLMLTRPCIVGRRRQCAGQLLIPLPGLTAPRHAAPLAA